MLSAIAERRPRLRSKPSSPRAPGSARCSRAKRASRISVIWTSCTAAPAGRTARGCARRGAPSHPHGPLTERAVGAQLREHRAVVAERASALHRLRCRQPRRLELLALGGERPELRGQLGEADVVGRLLGHRPVQAALALAEALERPLETGDLLARLAHRATAAGGPDRRAARRSRSRRRRVGRRVRLREVLLDAAGEMAERARAVERVHVVADAFDEPAVVADDDERAGPPVEEILEGGERVDVEVVRRLVEQQHVGLGHEQAHQLKAAPLAAGEVAHERPTAVAVEAEALRDLAGGELAAVAQRDPPADLGQRLEHAKVAGNLHRVLAQVRESHRRTVAPRSTVPASGARTPESTSTSVVLPDPFAPTTATRSPGPRRHVASRTTTRSPNATETASASMTLPPRRAVAKRSSSTRSRGSGSPAISALAASMRNFGFDVRAGGPRRSQASSLRTSWRRRSSRAAACRSRSARART